MRNRPSERGSIVNKSLHLTFDGVLAGTEGRSLLGRSSLGRSFRRVGDGFFTKLGDNISPSIENKKNALFRTLNGVVPQPAERRWTRACETLAVSSCAETTNSHKTCATPCAPPGSVPTTPWLHSLQPNPRSPALTAVQCHSGAIARPRSTHRFPPGSPIPKAGKRNHESSRPTLRPGPPPPEAGRTIQPSVPVAIEFLPPRPRSQAEKSIAPAPLHRILRLV